MKNIQKLMKQAQQMQDQLQQAMGQLRVETSSGGGMVKVAMNGKKEVLSLSIDPQAVDPEDVEMLQDLIVAALTEAARQVDEALNSRLGGFTEGLLG